MAKIIGIDLGTTNSAVAVLEGKESKIITNPRKAIVRLLPSYHSKTAKRKSVKLPSVKQSRTRTRFHQSSVTWAKKATR